MPVRTIAAAKFKATCLSLMDEVEAKREPIIVTKNGKPLVKMVPLEIADDVDPLDLFRIPGVVIVGDIMSPVYSDEHYEAFYKRTAEQLHDTSH